MSNEYLKVIMLSFGLEEATTSNTVVEAIVHMAGLGWKQSRAVPADKAVREQLKTRDRHRCNRL